MVNVGLIGEDPNDTASIGNLLNKKYKNQVHFCPLVRGLKGSQLDTLKIKKLLPIEFSTRKCKFIVYIRDLDGFKTEVSKITRCRNWFKDLDREINNQGLLLLNIWELEGLIFADIATFNRLYKVSHNFTGASTSKKNPKEELKRITSKGKKVFQESHCPEIFKELNFDTVKKRCGYFEEFICEFDKKIAPKKKAKNK